MKPAISVVGLGYVGLCTAVCFASNGFPTYGFDIDNEKISSLCAGHSPIYEPQLESYLKRALKTRRFAATDDLDIAVNRSNVTFISVGTPSLANGSIDLNGVKQSSAAIGAALRKKTQWHLIVLRSTVIPNTCDSIVKPEIENASGKKCGQKWGLCMNPEFLKEGSAIHDTLHPDRIVIGEFDGRSGAELAKLYTKFIRRKVTAERMSLVNAELVKYASNAFLAMKVSFANMIANLCETLPTADVQVVTHAMGLDKRIGHGFLRAGLGFGGSCFPKDLKALNAFGKERSVDLPLVAAAMEINDKQPIRAVSLGEKLVGALSGKRVAVLGLAFKPETDDMREATSIRVIRELLSRHANVVVYDPKAIQQAGRTFGDAVTYAQSAAECLRGSSLCILVTEWPNFSELKAKDFEKLMEIPAIVDGRRLLDASQFARTRFAAIGLGPPNREPVNS